MKANPKIGIALSGGGIRGVAHLGVLKALNEAGIYPDEVAGTSAGAIAGTLYCCGYTPDEIFDIIVNTNFFKLLRPAISWKGFLKMEVVEQLYKKHIQTNEFSELKIPLFIAATNLSKGRTEYFHQGEIIRPLMASSCIPGIFDPISIDNSLYVDGGILNNLPVDPLKGRCDYIIAVNCNHLTEVEDVPNMKQLIERSVIMAMNYNVYNRKSQSDFFIEPPGLANFGVFDIKKADEIFDAGYQEAKTYLSTHSALSVLGDAETED